MRAGLLRFAVTALSCAAGLCQFTAAGDFKLTAHDMSFNARDVFSPPLIIGIENVSGTDKLLRGWCVDFAIVPEPGSTGTILSLHGSRVPPNYLFANNPTGIYELHIGPGLRNTLLGSAGYLDTGVVPASGANILQTQLAVLPETHGVFDVVLVPGSYGDPLETWWHDGEGHLSTFTNAPLYGDPVVIGTITVVPEPSSLALVIVAGGALVLLAQHRSSRAVGNRRRCFVTRR